MTAPGAAAGAGPLVVDTYAAIWYLHQDPRLSRSAEAHIDSALADGHAVHVPLMCLVELVYLVDKGRIPEAVAQRLSQVLAQPEFGFHLAVLDWRRGSGHSANSAN